MKIVRNWLLLLFASLLPFIVTAQEPPPEIEVDGEGDLFLDRGVWVGEKGVRVRYGQAVLTAQRASVHLETGEVTAEGDVFLQSGEQVWRGERLLYNFRTREMGATQFRLGQAPFFAAGGHLITDPADGSYTASNAMITADDVQRPAYRVHARSIRVVPGQVIEARNAVLYLGRVPVMFFPIYRRNLDRESNNFTFTPGYRSVFGPYLLTTYNWYWSTNVTGGLHLDYRQKRGVGAGPSLRYDLGAAGSGDFLFYYLRDEAPRTDPAGQPIREHRHRINFSHLTTIRTNLTAKIVLREQSDPQVIRDFFESDYRENPQPKSFLEVSQLWPNFSLDLLAQPQVNDFFQTVERLPDVKLSAFRQQIGVSPLFYEGESSVGYFRFQSHGLNPTNYAALRADTFHQVLLPWNFFGWLNVTPRVGGRFTHYGETEGFGTTTHEQNRFVFNTGAEVSTKASRVWRGARSRLFDIHELRHIIEPSVNYVFVPNPSRAPRELPQFDTELPSLRLLPIDFPDYYAIDSVDSQNVLRLGLLNRLQTKRKLGIDQVVNWALFTDWRLDRRAGQTTFADLYSDLDVRPRAWLGLSSETRVDVASGTLRMANHTVTIQPGDVWSLAVGHRYFKDDPAFGLNSGNNLIRTSLYYRLNENWGFRTTHHFEARDGVLEEHFYTVYRDLRSWTAALTLRFRESRFGADDFTIAVTFSLKAFPRFGLGRDRDQHSFLLGG